MTDIAAMVELITRGGLVTVLAVALWGGMKGWYVWGVTHTKELTEKDKVISDRDIAINKLEKDRDYWRDFSVRLLTANEKTADCIDVLQKKS